MSPIQQLRLRLGHAANLALATPPRFVIMASPRSGTAYAAQYLTRIGVRCSHEGYFTPEGPKLWNKDRRFGAVGDVSWMSVPFVAGKPIKRLHQTRHPWTVISSLYRIGLFDPALRQRYRRYRDFIDAHFDVGDCPIDNCVRWYVDWNTRCEAEAEMRYQVEAFETALPRILATVAPSTELSWADLPANTNSRETQIGGDWVSRLSEGICNHPRLVELKAMSLRYGYDEAVAGPS